MILPRKATQYLLWFGGKSIAHAEGLCEAPTGEEFNYMLKCREATISLAHKIMRLKEKDYTFTPGQTFDELLSRLK